MPGTELPPRKTSVSVTAKIVDNDLLENFERRQRGLPPTSPPTKLVEVAQGPSLFSPQQQSPSPAPSQTPFQPHAWTDSYDAKSYTPFGRRISETQSTISFAETKSDVEPERQPVTINSSSSPAPASPAPSTSSGGVSPRKTTIITTRTERSSSGLGLREQGALVEARIKLFTQSIKEKVLHPIFGTSVSLSTTEEIEEAKRRIAVAKRYYKTVGPALDAYVASMTALAKQEAKLSQIFTDWGREAGYASSSGGGGGATSIVAGNENEAENDNVKEEEEEEVIDLREFLIEFAEALGEGAIAREPYAAALTNFSRRAKFFSEEVIDDVVKALKEAENARSHYDAADIKLIPDINLLNIIPTIKLQQPQADDNSTNNIPPSAHASTLSPSSTSTSNGNGGADGGSSATTADKQAAESRFIERSRAVAEKCAMMNEVSKNEIINHLVAARKAATTMHETLRDRMRVGKASTQSPLSMSLSSSNASASVGKKK